MRRFRILDALLLISGLAFAIAVHRVLQPAVPLPDTTIKLALELRTLVVLTLTFVTWTLAIIIATDRVPISVSARSPGKLPMVCIGICSIASVVMHWNVLFNPDLPLHLRILQFPFKSVGTPSIPACVVISCYCVQRMAKLQKPLSDWLDHVGMYVGALWILIAMAEPLHNFYVIRWLGWA